MELRIQSWQSKGLRCPDLAVNLVDASNEKGVVSIIQMPNGTGKTTTLELIRACMTGSARDWSSQQVMEFQSASQAEEGLFRVDLSVDEQPLVFELLFDFMAQRALYTTTSPAIGGRRDGWEPPPDVRRFLHPDFIDLIVFDGEFASDILDPSKTNAERAVDAMSQLYLLDRARSLAEQERKRIVSEAGVTGDVQALNQTKKKLEIVTLQLARIRKAKQKFESELAEGEGRENQLRNQFDEEARRQAGVNQQLDDAKSAVDDAKAELNVAASNVFSAIRIPSLLSKEFSNSLVELNKGLDSVQLPSSTSRQFFLELAEGEECICGREITSDVRRHIVSQAEQFLGQEHAGVLNAIKTQIQSMVNSADEEIESVDVLGDRLTNAINRYYQTKTDLDELTEQLAEPGGNLAAIRDELAEKESKNNKLRDVLEDIARPPSPDDNETSNCLSALQRQKESLEKKLETLTGTVDIGQRTRVINELLTRSREKARDVVRSKLVENGNARLLEILRQSPVQIESMGSHISLKSQGDASVGQKLAVGYVILGGLLHRGAHSLPFVVDSPANPIDNTVRREIAKMLPELCDQFVTFVISSEKPSFTDVLGQNASKAQYITIFRKLEATLPYLERLPNTGVAQTDDFVLVENREFFDAFDVDDQ